MSESDIKICDRQNTCFDCDDTSCPRCGYKGADCPKYYQCDNPNGLNNCDHCEFIDGFIKEMRLFYEMQRRNWNDNE